MDRPLGGKPAVKSGFVIRSGGRGRGISVRSVGTVFGGEEEK